MMPSKMPGDYISQRVLPFYFVADTSSSMRGAYIQSLNCAMAEIIPHLKRMSGANAGNNAPIWIRTMKFDMHAMWVDNRLIPASEYTWSDLKTGMGTFAGQAFKLLAEEFKTLENRRILPPVVVFVSDGCANDDYREGLAAFLATKVGKNAVKIAVSIGDETDTDMLSSFIDECDVPILTANDSEQVINYIMWASLSAVRSSLAGDRLTAPTTEELDHFKDDMSIELFEA